MESGTKRHIIITNSPFQHLSGDFLGELNLCNTTMPLLKNKNTQHLTWD